VEIVSYCAELLQQYGKLIIYLNMAYNKTDEDVIESVAHELAHLRCRRHTNKFYDEYEKLKAEIKQKMEA